MSFHETQGVLTSTKQPGGNLMHKHETLITSSSHFSSGIVEGAKRERAWKLPHARKPLSPPPLAFLAWGDFHARSRFARSTIPEEKWGLLVVYVKLQNWSWWERTPYYKVWNQLNRLKRNKQSHHSPYLLKLSKPEMARTIWFSNRNFRLSHVNGKYSSSPSPHRGQTSETVSLKFL